MGLFDFLKHDKKKQEERTGATAKASAASRTAPAASRPHPGPAEPSDHSAAHKAVPVPPKPAPTAKKRTYTVRPGDSLSAIARRELGDEARWREVYAMNRGVIGTDPDVIHPGQVLTLPV
ncbi:MULTISPECIES: LysM peptidoglycan-binding domain-containing protein [unclassified Streptomyces]|uniref:LysM peptidoglycan-binding domain-containing protein n=1 Tax=unclassified Streptomyces TaxID=2593676 RepID=UPI0033C2E5FB